MERKIKQLAIVIPAFKIDFFNATLQSLANQTCKDFTVYIGDDCSPSDFMSLVLEYEKQISIVYHRFDENLGGKDLVGQWSRCIGLTQREPWIWLFSDDDVVGENCVELFYKEIEVGAKYDIYHYDVKIINSEGYVVYEPREYPKVIDVEKLYIETSKNCISSFVVENIFSRTIYEKVGGFEEFPLAWGSDMATWLKMGQQKGIKTIGGDYIFWRRSDKNITPSKDREIVKLKFLIQTDFYDWVGKFFNSDLIRKFNRYVFFRYCVHYSNIISYFDMKEIFDYAIAKSIVSKEQKYFTLLLLPLLRVCQFVKAKMIKK